MGLPGFSEHAAPLAYPKAPAEDTRDSYFGVSVPDPYRWLEDADSEATYRWLGEQRVLSREVLSQLPARSAFQRRLRELWRHERRDVPVRAGEWLFYRRNTGLQNQSALWRQPAAGGDPEVVLDPNALSTDGAVAVNAMSPSPDGRYVAYALAEGGSDLSTYRVRDIATGKDLPDVVQRVYFSVAAWTRDNAGFFYARYPGDGGASTATHRNHQVLYHRLGTDQSADRLVFAAPESPNWMFWPALNHDGRYLFICAQGASWLERRVYVVDLCEADRPTVDAPVVKLLDAGDANYVPIGIVKRTFFLLTSLDAPNYRVIAVDLDNPIRPHWRTIVAQQRDPVDGAAYGVPNVAAILVGDRIVVRYLSDVHVRLAVYGLDGTQYTDVPLPDAGAVPLLAWPPLSADERAGHVYVGFGSTLQPTTVYRYDVGTGQCQPFARTPPVFDASPYVTQQVFCVSKDGTRVPMFVTGRRDLVRDGSHPALLTAYGGFGISMTPYYDPANAAWLEQGGVLAVANVRGGGEYGEAWHQAGMLERKTNVFDDFFAASEWLIEQGYTSPAKLSIQGLSNGGLLVGVAVTRRPELFAAAVPHIGVFDMLRYHRFTAGAMWVGEYGSADDETQFGYLLRYSPLHNVTAGRCYPAVLVTTSDHDDRVLPAHSYKFSAALQAAQSCTRPILLRVESNASHGYSPTELTIDRAADVLAFLAHATGMTVR